MKIAFFSRLQSERATCTTYYYILLILYGSNNLDLISLRPAVLSVDHHVLQSVVFDAKDSGKKCPINA